MSSLPGVLFSERSSANLDSTKNFERFLECLESSGYTLDRRWCHSGTHAKFSFQFRRIAEKAICFSRMDGISPFSVSLLYEGKPAGDYVALIAVLRGTVSVINRQSKNSVIPRGGFFLMDATELFTLVNSQASDIVMILMPSAYFHTHVGHRVPYFLDYVFPGKDIEERCFMQAIAIASSVMDFAKIHSVPDYCDGCFCFLRPVLTRFAQEHAGGYLAARSDIRVRATAIMRRDMGKCGVRISSIALELGISERYLAMAFSEIGTTPHKRLIQIRLEQASVNLRETHNADQSILDIARSNGFPNLAGFERAFRHQYGMSPREWRNHG